MKTFRRQVRDAEGPDRMGNSEAHFAGQDRSLLDVPIWTFGMALRVVGRPRGPKVRPCQPEAVYQDQQTPYLQGMIDRSAI